MRRIPVVLVLLLAATVWPVTSGLAHRPSTTHAAADGSLQADFDNDGFPDLAIGVIGEDAGTEHGDRQSRGREDRSAGGALSREES